MAFHTATLPIAALGFIGLPDAVAQLQRLYLAKSQGAVSDNVNGRRPERGEPIRSAFSGARPTT